MCHHATSFPPPAPLAGAEAIYYYANPAGMVRRHYADLTAALMTCLSVITAMQQTDRYAHDDLRPRAALAMADTAAVLAHDAIHEAAMALPHLCTVLGVDQSELRTYRAHTQRSEDAAAVALRVLDAADKELAEKFGGGDIVDLRHRHLQISWVQDNLVAPLRALMLTLRPHPGPATDTASLDAMERPEPTIGVDPATQPDAPANTCRGACRHG